MKPSPLSAVLADDLLLDRVGARLDTDDDLGSLLLAVAHQADTPIPPAVRPRRWRSGHRGLTMLAALGVAVSGATVAAAVELAPTPADAASGTPHTRTFLPPSLQALVMPFLAGTPFQGRLVLPFGSLPTVPFVGTATAAGLPGSTFPADGLALPASSATPGVDSELGNQEQQDLSRQKTQAKGTQTGGQTGSQVNQAGSGTTESGDQNTTDEQPQSTPTPKPPKPTPTSTPTPTPTSNGGTNGEANGAGNGNGATNGQGNGHGRTTTTTGGTTGGTTTDGTSDTGTSDTGTAADDTGDDPVSGGPDKHGKTLRTTVDAASSGQPSTGSSTATSPSKAKTAVGTAPTTTAPPSTEAATSAGTVAAADGTVTP